MEKFKVVALFGPSGCGKDTIKKSIVQSTWWHGIVPSTTRPKRQGEQNGKEYFFLTNEDFAEEVLNGNMIEAAEFNNWFYGTSISALQENVINIGVFNPVGLEIIMETPQLDVLPIYIHADDKVRLQRSLDRETNPDCSEICRRFLADKKDFENLVNDNTYIFANNAPYDNLKEPYLGKEIYHLANNYWSI